MFCYILCKVNGNVKPEIIKGKLILRAMITMLTFSLLTKKYSPGSIPLSEMVNISYTDDFTEKSCSKTNSPSK